MGIELIKATYSNHGMKMCSLACFVFLIISGCQAKQAESPDKSLAGANSAGLSTEEFSPPASFILDLKAAATTILSVQITKVAEVRGSTQVFSGMVLKSFKGTVSEGSFIQYAGTSEKRHEGNLTDTIVVFLTHHQKPLAHLNVKDVYYSTVEDNGMIEPYGKLDSLLKP